MTVGFLALQPPDMSPSQRFRVEAFLPWLSKAGIRTDYLWSLSPSDLRVFYGSASTAAKLWVAARAAGRRIGSVTPSAFSRRYDAFLVQREAFFLMNAWSEWLAHLQAPIVYDFDDAIWIHAVCEANRRFGRFKNVEKIPRIIRMAHTVLAGNEYLAGYARQFNERVRVVPTCVDTDRYVPAPRSGDGTVVVGWSGSPSTVAHLMLAIPALVRIRQRYGNRVRFKVVGDPGFRHPGLGITGEAWSSDSEVSALQSMDIGIMPLPDDEWSKGKCGLKALTYMSVGIPAVIAAIGVNPEIVQDGVNGFTPRSEDEWVERMSLLIDDPDLRRRLGDAGRRTVIERYSVLRWRDTVLEVLQTAAASRR